MATLHLGPEWIKWLGLGCLVAALTSALFGVVSNPQSLPYRYWSLYVASLERKLRNMFIVVEGRYIAFGQLGAAALALGAALYLHNPTLYLAVPVIAIAPALYIENMRKQRLKRIEAKLDGLILTLANALKTTPSIGTALAYAQPL